MVMVMLIINLTQVGRCKALLDNDLMQNASSSGLILVDAVPYHVGGKPMVGGVPCSALASWYSSSSSRE